MFEKGGGGGMAVDYQIIYKVNLYVYFFKYTYRYSFDFFILVKYSIIPNLTLGGSPN